MGKHEWVGFVVKPGENTPGRITGELELCLRCGIVAGFKAVRSTQCPPWSSTGGGDNTKPQRTHETGEVEILKFAETTLMLIDSLILTRDLIRARMGIEEVRVDLRRLIQTREGRDAK